MLETTTATGYRIFRFVSHRAKHLVSRRLISSPNQRCLLKVLALLCAILSATGKSSVRANEPPTAPFAVVLGIAQDAGYPQAGCKKDCCAPAWSDSSKRRHTASLAIVDPISKERWLIDCTPNFPDQLQALDTAAGFTQPNVVSGILLTHAHIGHYAGLVHLGREVMGADNVPVYTMPRMRAFLKSDGPWSQLVALRNIRLNLLRDGAGIRLNKRIRITPLQVPHRDEFSETVGYRIQGPEKSALYLPDIDKWERWSNEIEKEIAKVDVAWLDGTFFDGDELPGRDMSKIPHPFIVESIARFAPLPKRERAKIRFIHLNHTNTALDETGPAAKVIREAGHNVARQGAKFPL